MLDDQTFAVPRIIALGIDFFAEEDNPDELDYALATQFAHRLDRARERYAFHVWDLDTEDVRQKFEILQAWGVPLELGKLFSTTPTAKEKKQLDRMLLTAEYIHARNLCGTYRIAGARNISTIRSEYALLAIVQSLDSLDPYSLQKYIRQAAL